MKDRVPLYPGRVKLEPVAGQTNIYDMTRADSPQQVGTKLNKANLLTDETVAKIWPNASERPADPTPNNAFDKIASTPAFEVGDILTTVRTDLGDKWLLCNGQIVYQSDYPELYAKLLSTESEVWEQLTDIAAGKNNYICSPIVYAEGYFAFLFFLSSNSPAILRLYYMSAENWGTWSVTNLFSNPSSVSADFSLKYSNGYWYVHASKSGYPYLYRSQQHNLESWSFCDISGSSGTMSLTKSGLMEYDIETDCFYGAQNDTNSSDETRPCFVRVSNSSIGTGSPSYNRYILNGMIAYTRTFNLCGEYLVASISYQDAVMYSAKDQFPTLLDTNAMPHDPEHSGSSGGWVHSMSDGTHIVLINNFGNFIYTTAENIPNASSWQFIATGKVLVKMWRENGKYYLECHIGVSNGDGVPTSLDVYSVENFSDVVSLNWGTPVFQNVTDHINTTDSRNSYNSYTSILENTLVVSNGSSTETVPSNFWRYFGNGKTAPNISVSGAYEYIKAKE